MADSSKKSPVVPPEVRELIEKSQEIQGWVERLAEHADAARPEVYRRVLSDYEGRLEKVTGRLVKHRADLVSNLEEHETRVASLEQDRDAHAAELEEARLRHAVGEYSDDDWEERRGGIEDSISGIDERLAVEEGAVRELSEIISSIGEGGTPAVGDAASAAKLVEVAGDTEPDEKKPDVASGPDAATAEHADPAEAAPERTEASAAAPSVDVADGAKERSVREEAAPAKGGRKAEKEEEPASLRASAGEEEEAEDAATGDYLDELEFLESLSLDEAERFDAVSAMLDDDETGNGKKES